MNKNRLIFFGALGVFHLVLVTFTFYVDANKGDFQLLIRLLDWMSLFKYGSLIGLFLIIADVIWSWKSHQEFQKENEILNSEIKTLKAKLFDLQEDARKAQEQQQQQPK